jgi:hypothetical protein
MKRMAGGEIISLTAAARDRPVTQYQQKKISKSETGIAEKGRCGASQTF